MSNQGDQGDDTKPMPRPFFEQALEDAGMTPVVSSIDQKRGKILMYQEEPEVEGDTIKLDGSHRPKDQVDEIMLGFTAPLSEIRAALEVFELGMKAALPGRDNHIDLGLAWSFVARLAAVIKSAVASQQQVEQGRQEKEASDASGSTDPANQTK